MNNIEPLKVHHTAMTVGELLATLKEDEISQKELKVNTLYLLNKYRVLLLTELKETLFNDSLPKDNKKFIIDLLIDQKIIIDLHDLHD